MNQTAATTIDQNLSNKTSAEAVDSRTSNPLQRLVAWLDEVRQSPNTREGGEAHQSFIEENLLDPNVGPEISRTLRR